MVSLSRSGCYTVSNGQSAERVQAYRAIKFNDLNIIKLTPEVEIKIKRRESFTSGEWSSFVMTNSVA